MCAISGIYLKPNQTVGIQRYLNQMVKVQHHRGPDASGIWINKDKSVGLSHNRLSIIDLSQTGNQPMHANDGRYTLVFNGEIYNYQELKEQLIEKGRVFRTNTDSEVLIEAYRQWGESMLMYLRGMFAFALYEHATGDLFCARDRIGKKPFVYAQSSSGFIFASEIPAVLNVDGIDRSYDHDAIAAMLLHNFRHIPDPYTAYKGIKRLKAGHAMRIKNGEIEKQWRYWQPEKSILPINAQNLRQVVEKAVAYRMRADVPVGALLSGGIDSSAIVSLMQQQSAQPVHTYALGFDSNDEDLCRARQMAKQLGTHHKELYFNPEEQWEIFNKLIVTYGEPIMLLPLVHAYTLCRAIRDDGIKVVLSGNGADEIFYGYTGHTRTLQISRILDRLLSIHTFLSPLKHTRLGWLAAKSGKRKSTFYDGISKSAWKHCLTDDAINAVANRASEELEYWGSLCPSDQYIDESNFVALMLENTHSVTTAADLPAMAASIEVRAPFLDQDVISYALATPPEMKIPNVNNKHWLKAILRDAVTDLIPESLLKAPKRGFGSGIQEGDIFKGAWNQRITEIMSDPDTLDGFFSRERINKQWCSFLRDKSQASLIGKQLAIQCWLRNRESAVN